MSQTRQAVALRNDGRFLVVEEPIPALTPGTVLVKVGASLISPGTELGGGWRAVAERRRKPAPAELKSKVFGYSNAGVVLQVGEGVTEFRPGDRVACVGGGRAQHATHAVVPHHLCVALPENVTFAQGSYAMLVATAMHALRRGAPEFGENTAILGLGLVGQLAARLYQLAGCFVIGWDTIPERLAIARRWGIDSVALVGQDDVVARTRSFTGNYGVDSAVCTIPGDANAAIDTLYKCLKVSPDGHPMGVIVVVGGSKFDYLGRLTNCDIRRASRTGPGYHDEAWEVGAPYPDVFMRWTTRTNLALSLRLIAEGKLNVDALTTHTVAIQEADRRLEALLERPDDLLGVVFEMPA